METDTTQSEFLNGGKATVEQILEQEEINYPKELDCQRHSHRSELES